MEFDVERRLSPPCFHLKARFDRYFPVAPSIDASPRPLGSNSSDNIRQA